MLIMEISVSFVQSFSRFTQFPWKIVKWKKSEQKYAREC